MPTQPAKPVRRKTSYHHGDLREGLIAASRRLLDEQGPDRFILADACRLAGVSTAAPYKHFRDKDEIIAEIVRQGFDDLRDRMNAAVTGAGAGTQRAMIEMSLAYLGYARQQSSVFRLMFGPSATIKQAPMVELCGRGCFGSVIDHVRDYCRAAAIPADAEAIALDLWSLVHGVACLEIDGDYEKVAPGLDAAALLVRAVPRLLAPHPVSAS